MFESKNFGLDGEKKFFESNLVYETFRSMKYVDEVFAEGETDFF